MARANPGLRRLNCALLSLRDISLAEVARQCPGLQELIVFFSNNLTDEGLVSVASRYVLCTC